MTKRKTTAEFIEEAKAVHGDRYDYSKVEYVSNKKKVCIICPKHGAFLQAGASHIKGRGCPKCSYERAGYLCRKSIDRFIRDCRKIHGDKYDYSKVKYINGKTKVCIICPIHGEFLQNGQEHFAGKGCPKCGGTKRLTTEEFIEKADIIHGGKYDYSKVEYVNSKKRIMVICKKHGEFYITPNMHLRGDGCKDCATIKKRKNKFLLDGYCIDFKTNSTEEEYYSYRRWLSMIERCYDPKVHIKQPSYIGCSVCREWQNYDNFKEWFDKNYVEGYYLDKDVLIKGNRIYSPNTCCFIPNEINVIFSIKSMGRKLPIGVSFNKTKTKYIARINKVEGQVHLGTFLTPELAFEAYKQAKEFYIKEVANKWKDKIAPNVYEAMMNYEVEITD